MQQILWIIVLFLISLGLFNLMIRYRPISESWLYLATAFSMIGVLGKEINPKVRIIVLLFSAIFLLIRAYVKRSEGKILRSRKGIKYPIDKEIRNDPAIKEIIQCNDFRISSGQGSATALNRICSHAKNHPNVKIRIFAIKALAVWPSFHIPGVLRTLLNSEIDNSVIEAILAVMEAVFDPSLSFFKHAKMQDSEVKDEAKKTNILIESAKHDKTHSERLSQKFNSVLHNISKVKNSIK